MDKMKKAMNNNGVIACKYCGSQDVVKFGKYKNTQLYWCKSCKRKFKGDDALFYMQVKPEYVSTALELYYTGSSVNDICLHLRTTQGYHPSKSVVFQWIDKFTDRAVDYFGGFRPQLGDVWAADETVLELDKGKKVWFWDIIDTKTRFLIASRASFTRGTHDAEALMEQAKRVAGKAPKKIITDKLRAYWDGIELVFGADTEHVMSSPFTRGEGTAIIERWHSVLKERTKVMKAFRTIDTLIQFTGGFLVYYNYLRPHESLGGKTPAEVAKVDYEVKTWADVCRIPLSEGVVVADVESVGSEASMQRVRSSKSLRRRKRGKKDERVHSSVTAMRGK